MKTVKRNSSDERRILIGMIVDRLVLARIAAKWEGELFRSKWSNLVAGWCIRFFQKYNGAPGKAIEGLFDHWASRTNDKDTVGLVEKFLESLSGEYEQLSKESNSDYVVDLASKHFNRVKLQRLAEQVSSELEDGEIEKAEKLVSGFGRIEMGSGSYIDIMQDQEAIKQAFAEKREPLVKYPGALGNFFGDALERDAFIAFMGAEKRGKTWWLLDLAWRSMMQCRKVAFFEVGDMSQNQVMRRLMARVTKTPLKPCKVKYPTFIERNPDEPIAQVTAEEREFTKTLNWKRAWTSCQQTLAKLGASESLFRLSCHPNSSISILGIRGILQSWEREGWVPDVLAIDYADILEPTNGQADSRDQINATWKHMRALSQSLHCLVVTATQANAASYKAETVDRSNFSEDKRKFAHVTGMVGINATLAEKEQGLSRLNWVVLREGEFSEEKCVHVAGCLPLGNPAIKSTF